MHQRSLLYALLLIALGLCLLDSVSASLTLKTFDLSIYPGASCNDGTPSGYYFSPGTTFPNRWVIHLQGGWWCWDDASCLSRDQNMVSSLGWPKTISPGGIFRADPKLSPDWAGVNLVYVPYCTSDAWAGSGAGLVNNTLWQFRGRDVVAAVFATFFAQPNTLSAPQEILFSGCSAGGQGLLYNLDAMADYVSLNTPAGLVFKGFADSGWMMNFPSAVNPTSEIHTQFKAGYKLWQPKPNTCTLVNPVDPSNCFFSPTLMPFLQTPVLIQSSGYDSFQVPYDCCSPPFTSSAAKQYSSEMAMRTREAMVALIKRPHAVYSPSCFTHCLFEGRLFTSVKFPFSLSDRLTNWFFGLQPPMGRLMIDDCGFNCSSSCPR